MTAFHRLALAPLLCLAAFAVPAQEPGASGEPQAPAPGAPLPGGALPGTVVERNVFVPVDSTGHTGGEYIVIERRVMKKGDAGKESTAEVPTHFILVPQDDEDDDPDSDDGGGAR